MLNQVTLVGRIYGLTYNAIYLNLIADKIAKPETIKILVSDRILDNVEKYCHEGDIVGIKGRLQTEGLDSMAVVVVAEKISFLTSKGGEE